MMGPVADSTAASPERHILLGPVQCGKGSEGQHGACDQHLFAQQQREAGFAFPYHPQEQNGTRQEKSQSRREKGRQTGIDTDFDGQKGCGKD